MADETKLPPNATVRIPGEDGPREEEGSEGDETVQTTTPPVTTPPGPKESEETVAVPKSLLERLVNTVEDQGKKIELLTEVADKNKIMEVERKRNGGKLIKSLRVSTLGGKYIIGWKRTIDDVHFDGEGRLVEKQMIELTFEDKSKQEISVRQFSNDLILVKGEAIRESRDNDGNVFYVIQFPDGKELEVSQSFIN